MRLARPAQRELRGERAEELQNHHRGQHHRRELAPERVLARMRYRHPLYSHGSVAAQGLRASIQGQRRTWFAGAWWGFGFHEDGLRSGVDVARALGVAW